MKIVEPASIEELFDLYERLGDRSYGESITQNEHALQCAALARDAVASDALIIAALFHDVGHLALDVQGDPASTSRATMTITPRAARASSLPSLDRGWLNRWHCTWPPSVGAARESRSITNVFRQHHSRH